MYHNVSIESVSGEDGFAYLGLRYCHLGYWRAGNANNFAQAQEDVLAELMDPLGIVAGQRVLDLVSGGGETAIWMAKRYQCDVVCVNMADASGGQISESIVREDLSEKVMVRCVDALMLDEGAGAFDHIVSVGAVHHFENKHALFGKLGSLLKSGGSLAVSIYTCPFRLSILQGAYLSLTFPCRQMDDIAVYENVLHDHLFCAVRKRDVSRPVLDRSFEYLFSEPARSRLEAYCRARYGWWRSTLILLLRPLVNLWMLRTKKLRLFFLYAERIG